MAEQPVVISPRGKGACRLTVANRWKQWRYNLEASVFLWGVAFAALPTVLLAFILSCNDLPLVERRGDSIWPWNTSGAGVYLLTLPLGQALVAILALFGAGSTLSFKLIQARQEANKIEQSRVQEAAKEYREWLSSTENPSRAAASWGLVERISQADPYFLRIAADAALDRVNSYLFDESHPDSYSFFHPRVGQHAWEALARFYSSGHLASLTLGRAGSDDSPLPTKARSLETATFAAASSRKLDLSLLNVGKDSAVAIRLEGALDSVSLPEVVEAGGSLRLHCLPEKEVSLPQSLRVAGYLCLDVRKEGADSAAYLNMAECRVEALGSLDISVDNVLIRTKTLYSGLLPAIGSPARATIQNDGQLSFLFKQGTVTDRLDIVNRGTLVLRTKATTSTSAKHRSRLTIEARDEPKSAKSLGGKRSSVDLREFALWPSLDLQLVIRSEEANPILETNGLQIKRDSSMTVKLPASGLGVTLEGILMNPGSRFVLQLLARESIASYLPWWERDLVTPAGMVAGSQETDESVPVSDSSVTLKLVTNHRRDIEIRMREKGMRQEVTVALALTYLSCAENRVCVGVCVCGCSVDAGSLWQLVRAGEGAWRLDGPVTLDFEFGGTDCWVRPPDAYDRLTECGVESPGGQLAIVEMAWGV